MSNGNSTPFAASPFGLSASEVANEFFPAANRRTVNGITIVSDLNVEPSCTCSLEIEIEKNTTPKKEPTSDVGVTDFEVFAFLSRDTKLLQKAFEQSRLKENEACLYLDVSKNSLSADQPTWIRLGGRLLSQPESLRESLYRHVDLSDSNSLAKDDLESGTLDFLEG